MEFVQDSQKGDGLTPLAAKAPFNFGLLFFLVLNYAGCSPFCTMAGPHLVWQLEGEENM